MASGSRRGALRSRGSRRVSFVPGKALHPDRIESVSEKEAVGFKTDFNSWLAEGFDYRLLNIFAFQGFDPAVVWKHVYVKAGDHKMRFEEDVHIEIAMLIGLQIMKGNITVNNFRRMSHAGQREANRLMQKWGIVGKIGDDKRYAVTLPRLTSAFPGIASIMAENIPRDFKGPIPMTPLPSYVKTSVFPSCLPQGFAGNDLILKAVNLLSTDLSYAIDGIKKFDKDALPNDFEKQMTFTNNAYTSPALTESERLVVFIRVVKVEDYAMLRELGLKYKDVFGEIVSKEDWDRSFGSVLASGTSAENERAKKQAEMIELVAKKKSALQSFSKLVREKKASWDDKDAPDRSMYFRAIEDVFEEESEEPEDEEEEEETEGDEGEKEEEEEDVKRGKGKGKEKEGVSEEEGERMRRTLGGQRFKKGKKGKKGGK